MNMETISGIASNATDTIKGMTDQMAIPSVGMNMPKSVTDQFTNLKGASAMTGESHFLEETMNPSRVRQYLNNPKEQEKAKGMKWLLAMMSKGDDASEFFPDCVKLVVCKQVEVKKMVYMYLTRYADHNATCREVALLSINSFQKDLGASTQLVRALALRVLSSIRVPEIVQIQMLAVKKCASDSSPYVRKCAANALPKIYRVDKEQLEGLISVLERLFKDSSCMVLGSAVSAYNELCPERWDVIHPAFRHLCNLLADLDEWAQIQLLQLFSRYLRTQFCDPSPGARDARLANVALRSAASGAVAGQSAPRKIKRRVVKKAFYSDEEDESCEEEVEVGSPVLADSGSVFAGLSAEDSSLDPDHALLLKNSLPLLKSRNSGVVVAVCSLHYNCGSQSSATGPVIGKALVRILRNAREIQFVVLRSIASMARERPELFTSFLSDFFIKASDPYFTRQLKLEVMSLLTESSNVQEILRELQSYAKDSDKKFVVDVVVTLGRVADAQPDIAENCMQGLATLLRSAQSEVVVTAVVTVTRHLVQQAALSPSLTAATLKLLMQTFLDDYNALPDRMPEYDEDGKDSNGRLEPVALSSDAKASILYLVGEHFENNTLVQSVAGDILRLAASSFLEEELSFKLQAVGLAAKLYLHSQDTVVQQLVAHVLELGRYDLDYDLRDRSRFASVLLGLLPASVDPSTIDSNALETLKRNARQVILSAKLPPSTLLGIVAAEGLDPKIIGTLSSMVDHTVFGYKPLPDWPEVQPDASVREPPVEPTPETQNFYKDNVSDADSSSNSDSDSSDSDSDSDTSGSDDDSSGSGSDDSDSDDSDSSDSDSSGSDSSASEEEEVASAQQLIQPSQNSYGMTSGGLAGGPDLFGDSGLGGAAVVAPPMNMMDLMSENTAPMQTNSAPNLMGAGGMGGNSTGAGGMGGNPIGGMDSPTGGDMGGMLGDMAGLTMDMPTQPVAPGGGGLSASHTLLRREIAGGIMLTHQFVRGNISGSALQLVISFENTRSESVKKIRLFGSKLNPPLEINQLEPNQVVQLKTSIDVGASATIAFELRTNMGSFSGSLTVPPTELLSPLQMSESDFLNTKKQLGGFNEATSKLALSSHGPDFFDQVPKRILEAANVSPVTTGEIWADAGVAMWTGMKISNQRVLIMVKLDRSTMNGSLTINSDDTMLSATLLDALKKGALV